MKFVTSSHGDTILQRVFFAYKFFSILLCFHQCKKNFIRNITSILIAYFSFCKIRVVRVK